MMLPIKKEGFTHFIDRFLFKKKADEKLGKSVSL